MRTPGQGDEHTLSERRSHLRAVTSSPSGSLNQLGSARHALIDGVNNSWQDEKTTYGRSEEIGLEVGCCDLGNETSCPNLAWGAAASRKLRRMAFVFVLFFGLAFWIWLWYLQPRLEQEWELKEGFTVQGNGTYGIAKGGDFDGLRVQDLDRKLLPGGESDPHGARRLVFVGDVHGCADELKKLLKHIGFDEGKDHLVAVGDVISKGPDNIEVLDELIRLKASSVRGNHEDRILAMAPSVLAYGAETFSEGSEKDAALLRKLSPDHLKYLQSMPLVIRIPALPLASTLNSKTHSPIAEEILVVHAGLVPAVALEKQDPYFVMNMRSIYTKTHLPLVEEQARTGKSKPWHDIWGWYNDRLFEKKSLKDFRIWDSLEDDDAEPWSAKLGLASRKKWPKPQVVVYGHHAKAGLQIGRWSKGLDTSCVRGGKLTALVMDAKGEQNIMSVDCKEYMA